MRLGTEARSYKTLVNAEKALRAAALVAGISMDDLRWVIVAQPDGRFSPAVMFSETTFSVALIHHGVLIIN